MEKARETRPGVRAVAALVVTGGLAAGLLELAWVVSWRAVGGADARLGKELLHRHFLWMTPASSLVVFGLCGLVPVLLSRIRPSAAWRLARVLVAFLIPLTLLLRIRGLYVPAAALLAAGVARWLAPRIAAAGPRVACRVCPAVLAVWLVLLSISLGRDALQAAAEYRRQDPAPAGAPNILLVVLDTVRADALTPYGSAHDTTPNLARLAALGTRFQNARSAAPWTLPSHATMFTGRLPHELGVSPGQPLGTTYPTIAEHLRARGYTTAGFVANFIFGMADYGLSRGFSHYEDRPVSLTDVFGCSGLGRRVAAPAFDASRWAWSRFTSGPTWYNPADPHFVTHRRSASDIRQSFLSWVDRRPARNRPFFAFVNLLDAHAPYLPGGKLGKHVQCWADYEVLRDWDERRTADNLKEHRAGLTTPEERALARDCYDDCLAALDRELSRLINDLRARALLENTLVIVTSDHGENFGEHDLYSHGISLHRPELDVPLLIVWPGHVPAGRVITEPASLRDLPATLVDLAGQGRGAPFPGRSLARRWQGDSAVGLVYSELPELGTFAVQDGTKVYIRYSTGVEQFYDHALDPAEIWNIIDDRGARYDVARLRSAVDGLDTLRRYAARDGSGAASGSIILR